MLDQIKENRVPITVTIMAIFVAGLFALAPVRDNANRNAERAAAVASDQISTLEARIATLEAAANPADGADPLRAELDLIIKGLVNQTGRVSRLQDTVEAFGTASAGLANNDRIEAEIALAKRGLSNLTRRINTLSDQMTAFDGLPQKVDQLTVQMSNVERAITQVNRRVQDLRNTSVTAPQAGDNERLDAVAAQLQDILVILQTQ